MKATTGNKFKGRHFFLILGLFLSSITMSMANNRNGDDCNVKDVQNVSYNMDYILKNVMIEKIHVYSLEGDEVAQIEMDSAKDLLCFASMNPGEYMFKVFTSDGTFLQPVNIPKHKK